MLFKLLFGLVALPAITLCEVLTVSHPGTGVPPSFDMTQPADVEAAPGEPARFEVRVSSDSPVTYQWFFNDGLIPGATNNSLLVNRVTTADLGFYFVEVTKQETSIRSRRAQLTFKVTLEIQPAVHVSFMTEPNNTYLLQSSSNLTDWRTEEVVKPQQSTNVSRFFVARATATFFQVVKTKLDLIGDSLLLEYTTSEKENYIFRTADSLDYINGGISLSGTYTYDTNTGDLVVVIPGFTLSMNIPPLVSSGTVLVKAEGSGQTRWDQATYRRQTTPK